MTDQSTVQHRRIAENTADRYAEAERYCDEMTGSHGLHAVVVEVFNEDVPAPGTLGELHTFSSKSESNLLSAVANLVNGREYDIQYETGPQS